MVIVATDRRGFLADRPAAGAAASVFGRNLLSNRLYRYGSPLRCHSDKTASGLVPAEGDGRIDHIGIQHHRPVERASSECRLQGPALS